ncbi:MAG: hypothetical protein ACRBB3_02295 [Alphaproteobacteria bacterium]
MSAFEYLENLVNSVFGGNDLKDYDVVVELDVGTHAVSDDPILFVSKDGVGEYIDMPAKDIEAQKADGGITLKTISDLKNDSTGDSANAAAMAGADAIMDNIGVYNAGQYPDLPFDIENLKATVSADDLGDIKTALENVMGDLINNSIPDIVYTEEGRVDTLSPQGNVDDIHGKITTIEAALVGINASLNAENIIESMKSGLPDAELTNDQKGIVLEELGIDTDQGAAPNVGAVQAVKVGM